MFHARIRSPYDAFHFIGEVTPYNMQTLRQHVRQSLREHGRLTISLELDSRDEPAFAHYTARWLPQLFDAGTEVEVEVAAPAGHPPAGAQPVNLKVTLTAAEAAAQ
jgi:hypothetical protein